MKNNLKLVAAMMAVAFSTSAVQAWTLRVENKVAKPLKVTFYLLGWKEQQQLPVPANDSAEYQLTGGYPVINSIPIPLRLIIKNILLILTIG